MLLLVSLQPISTISSLLLSAIDVTPLPCLISCAVIYFSTSTVIFFFIPVRVSVTVIVTEPGETAVIKPVSETVATEVLLLEYSSSPLLPVTVIW